MWLLLYLPFKKKKNLLGHIWCLEASPTEPTVGEALQYGPKTLLRKLRKHQGGYECNCVSLLQFSPPAPVGILLYLFMSPFLYIPCLLLLRQQTNVIPEYRFFIINKNIKKVPWYHSIDPSNSYWFVYWMCYSKRQFFYFPWMLDLIWRLLGPCCSKANS